MSNSAHRSVAACPWCGPGSQMVIRGDGMGGEALWCVNCLAKGPTVPMGGDFDDTDTAAIERWGKRAAAAVAVPADVLTELARALSIQEFMEGGAPSPDCRVGVRRGDLLQVMKAAGLGH